MTARLPDRADVEAPVRQALAFLVARGTASFAVAVAALLPISLGGEGPLHEIGHALLPAVLAIVVVARTIHVGLVRQRADGTGVWARAYGTEPGETALAAATAIIVPVAWLVGGSAILVHHVSDPVPMPGAIAAVYGPAFVVLWVLATAAWAGDCRERLALAFAESERRFREYWERVRAAGDSGP
ncbi:MAG TPA: hypothetical protein VFS32_07485 [Candidatus Limnocylindrales bacterium]|nr:hypothetical protein [Candidatus Limnocylindrales bacterium]